MKISIIIPCYNESEDIKRKTKIVLDYLKDKEYQYEILLVNDGSKDDTFNVIKNIPGAKGIGYEENKGKGGAVNYGLSHMSGDYALFMDADLSTDLSAIDLALPYLLEGYDFVIGSRHLKDSDIKIKQPLKRRFIGKCCRIIVNTMFNFHYKDTQCGFKFIKRDVALKVAHAQIINGFAFDVEYLYMAKINKLRIKEIPVIWSDDRGSTVSAFKSSVKFFKDLFKIKRNKKNYKF